VLPPSQSFLDRSLVQQIEVGIATSENDFSCLDMLRGGSETIVLFLGLYENRGIALRLIEFLSLLFCRSNDINDMYLSKDEENQNLNSVRGIREGEIRRISARGERYH
jgi:hypothetical protein